MSFEAVHSLTHTIDAVDESIVELLSVTDEAMIVDLKIVGVPMDGEVQLLGDSERVSRVEYEEQ